MQNKIVIVTRQLFYGAPQALRDYLIQKHSDTVVFIGLPFLTQRNLIIQIYQRGQEKQEKQIYQKDLGILSQITEFFQLLLWFLAKRQVYALFIGVDPLNCLLGLLLKKSGLVKKVIFYSIDFTPIRFENRFINFFYHFVEGYCVKHADEVWNVSPRITEGREKFLHIGPNEYPQKVVPIGVWNKMVRKIPFEKVKKSQVVFLGHLLKKQSVQEMLSAIPQIIRDIPRFHFVILGGGEYEVALKQQVKKLHIEKYVSFKGWIKERELLDKTLGESAIAIATYVPEKDRLRNFSYYGDPTKLKDYLAAGMPVILTNVSYNAKILEEKKCGIVVEYESRSIAKAVLYLLKDQKKLKEYRRNALLYANQFDWKTIFTYAFAEKKLQ